MARHLLTIGHSYSVALNRRLGWSISRASKGRWEVEMIAPSSFPGDLGPIQLVEEAHESGRLHAVSTHWARRIHLMWYGNGLSRMLQDPRWDLVHCWEEPYILAGAQVAWLSGRRRPIVFSTYQNIVKRYPPPFSQMELFCIDRLAGWIAGGQLILQTRLESGYGRQPHCMIPMGVDVQEFAPKPESCAAVHARLEWSEDGPPVVGFIGRFVEEKGLRVLTQALERCVEPWRAMFLGGGPLEAFLKTWAQRYGDRVRVVPAVPHAEIPVFLNAMDLLCAPSQTTPRWREQFGRVLIEAFACGVPVIASNSGEIPFVVGDAGKILPEDDIAGWARTIDRVLHDPFARKNMSAAGLSRAHAEFDWMKIGARHIEFFESLL